MAGNRRYDAEEWDDGYDDEVGYSYDSTGMSPSVSRYMYQRDGVAGNADNDDDLIDGVLVAVQDIMGSDLSQWTIEELSDIVRRFEYNEERVAAHLFDVLEDKSDKKTGDDLFDFDDDDDGGVGGTKGKQGAHFSSLATHLQATSISPAFPYGRSTGSISTSTSRKKHVAGDVARLNKFLTPELPSDVVRFNFDEPSPDDIATSKQSQAFTRGGAAAAAGSAKTNAKSAGVPKTGPVVVGGGGKKGPIVAGGKKTAHLPVGGASTPNRPASTPPSSGKAKGSSKDSDKTGTKVTVTNVGGGSHGHHNGHTGSMGLGHELLQPSNPPSQGLSTSGSLLTASSEIRSGSKSKLVKQMPEPKRDKVLKELLEEAALVGKSSTNKSHLNMVVIGHVDSGKSTTMGHLLYQLGHVEKKTIDKFEHESRTIGKATFHFAWVMDEQAEERARGVTIDVAVQHFETDRHKVTILDAPGHQDFVPNMISGAAQADVAVLVVNASDAEYQTILELGQAKEHIVLARSLGVSQLIVAINKLDTCAWSKERFEFVRDLLLPFLKKSGFKESVLQFIPTSGLTGENLTQRNANELSLWYTGFTLIEAINNFAPAKRDLEKPFRMSINDIFRDPHVLGLTVAGKIESGFLTVGDKLSILPLGNIVGVKGIRVGSYMVDRASAGVNVEIGLLDIEEKVLSVGDVLCDPMAPVPLVQKIRAQLVTFDLDMPILKGKTVILYAANLNEPAVVTKLVGVCDQTGAIKTKNPRLLGSRVTAIVDIQFNKRKIPAELYKEYRGFGRFTLRDGGKTLAAGIITELEPSSAPSTSSSPAPGASSSSS